MNSLLTNSKKCGILGLAGGGFLTERTSFFSNSLRRLSVCKGAQPKLVTDNSFIKHDSCGYEGLSEIVSYRLLRHTNLSAFPSIEYHPMKATGCISPRLDINAELITLYRGMTRYYSRSLKDIIGYYTSTYDVLSTSWYDFVLKFIQVYFNYDARDFLSLLFQFDRLILNTDRHFNNILFMHLEDGYSPIVFDCGAAFCSDQTLFSGSDILAELKYALCKPFDEDFDKQVAIAQSKSSTRLTFLSNLIPLMISDIPYAGEDKLRVKLILEYQMSKYYPEVKLQWI